MFQKPYQQVREYTPRFGTHHYGAMFHYMLAAAFCFALAACSGGGGTATHTVTATAGSGGAISPASVAVNDGSTTTFTVTPNTGYIIASVTGCNGTLNGATYTTGAVTADCTVTASFATGTHTINATAGNGGTISPASVVVNDGSTTTFTVTPDTGYIIASVTGCNGTLNGATYTTGAITADCTVTASFVVITGTTHTVTATAGAGGTVNPLNVAVNDGSTTDVTITPDVGYAIGGVTGCGGSLNGAIYTTGVVTADCTVTASFIVTHTATATAGVGGIINPSSATVNDGSTATFGITPNVGYAISSVTGCGGTLSGTTYTTGAITADCSVTATFIVTHTVTATAGTGGTIDPSSISVNDGSTTSFSVTPDASYKINNVTGCGGSLSGTTYTTGVITADCTVTATFIAVNQWTWSGGSNTVGAAGVYGSQGIAAPRIFRGAGTRGGLDRFEWSPVAFWGRWQ